MSQNKRIKILNLFNNNLGPAGAAALAQIFAENKSITELNLGHNDIGCEGLGIFAPALAQNTTITKLKLDGINQLKFSCIDVLLQNKTIADIYLKSSDFKSDEQAKIQEQAVTQMKKRKVIINKSVILNNINII